MSYERSHSAGLFNDDRYKIHIFFIAVSHQPSGTKGYWFNQKLSLLTADNRKPIAISSGDYERLFSGCLVNEELIDFLVL